MLFTHMIRLMSQRALLRDPSSLPVECTLYVGQLDPGTPRDTATPVTMCEGRRACSWMRSVELDATTREERAIMSTLTG